jgi:hypothetical protein
MAPFQSPATIARLPAAKSGSSAAQSALSTMDPTDEQIAPASIWIAASARALSAPGRAAARSCRAPSACAELAIVSSRESMARSASLGGLRIAGCGAWAICGDVSSSAFSAARRCGRSRCTRSRRQKLLASDTWISGPLLLALKRTASRNAAICRRLLCKMRPDSRGLFRSSPPSARDRCAPHRCFSLSTWCQISVLGDRSIFRGDDSGDRSSRPRDFSSGSAIPP